MSDVTATDGTAPAPAAVSTDTVDSGQAVSTESTGAPTTEAFDWTQYGDHVVTVKVDGQDLQVPMKEAIAGYQRQADYTRKSQALADQAKDQEFALALATALERNPAETIKYLSEQFGLNEDTSSQEVLTPEEEQLRNLQSEVQSLSSFQQQQMVAQEFEQLRAEFGDDIDERAVLEHAVKINAQSLRDAYASMRFADLHKQLADFEAAQKAHADKQQEADTQARDAAAQATDLISTGHGTQPGVVSPEVSSGKKRSLRESLEMAARATGFPL